MSLEDEIKEARKEISSDGYDMSLGEVINLYKDKELEINPEFQRLFRWNPSQKTRFIESILLGIPTPPIFVFQTESGTWELIDGLQRLSTVLEFCGVLKDPDGKSVPASSLDGTNLLPSLAGRTWEVWADGDNSIDKTQQLILRRSRIRVEILLSESDESAKYELFQRLNTGGAKLTEQEVRNCVAIMTNVDLHNLLVKLSAFQEFASTTSQTDQAIEKQSNIELVLRYFAFRLKPYEKGLDVHEYLDAALLDMATNHNIDWKKEEEIFLETFSLLHESVSENAFKKWDGDDFKGKFLMSVFECAVSGISNNIDEIKGLGRDQQKEFVILKLKSLWESEEFIRNSGAGVRGTTRLANLLPMAKEHFRP